MDVLDFSVLLVVMDLMVVGDANEIITIILILILMITATIRDYAGAKGLARLLVINYYRTCKLLCCNVI